LGDATSQSGRRTHSKSASSKEPIWRWSNWNRPCASGHRRPIRLKQRSTPTSNEWVAYGCKKEHAQAAHLGIGSHNLFDIAFALLLRAESGAEGDVCFEMLEGMADHMRRVVAASYREICSSIVPQRKKKNFRMQFAYLVRRLDENTAPENFCATPST